jgi:hypothetical protein
VLPGCQPPTRVHARNAAHGDTAASQKARKRGEQSAQTETAVGAGVWESGLARGQGVNTVLGRIRPGARVAQTADLADVIAVLSGILLFHVRQRGRAASVLGSLCRAPGLQFAALGELGCNYALNLARPGDVDRLRWETPSNSSGASASSISCGAADTSAPAVRSPAAQDDLYPASCESALRRLSLCESRPGGSRTGAAAVSPVKPAISAANAAREKPARA